MDFFSNLYDSLFGDAGIISNFFADTTPDLPKDVGSQLAVNEAKTGAAGMYGTDTAATQTNAGLINDIASQPDVAAQLKSTIDQKWGEGQGSFLSWVNGLDPKTKTAVGMLIAGGAKGALDNSMQNRQIDARKAEEDRARADVIRRGQVPKVAPGTFTAKPLSGGLIGG